MQYAVCNLSVVPVRKEPLDTSEMTTQLLFGETVHVLEKRQQWLKVRIDFDGYEGWIDEKQIQILTLQKYKRLKSKPESIAVDIVQSAFKSDEHIPVLAGSVFPGFDGMSFYFDKGKYIYNGQVITPSTLEDPFSFLEKCAFKYLHAPYLWGGRSPFGIDCSGFTQVVFRMLGVTLKRDAYQQATQGFDVSDHEPAKGDLVFFSHNQAKKITHVGIVLEKDKIIHASGRVRIDKLDHYGIYNQSEEQYTHKLKSIKRFW